MAVFKINGGNKLSGSVRAAGNKNAALPMIAAALLTDQPVFLENVPNIADVRSMLEIASCLGVVIEHDPARGTVQLQAGGLSRAELPHQACSEIRASILFAAPLLYRLGRAVMPPPGGDVIGRRRLDTHFAGLEQLGAQVEIGRQFSFNLPHGFQEADLFLPEASVTGTEHLLMAAVVAKGRTVIRNCACEPHVQDLARLLVDMGAEIQGIGNNTMIVEGVDHLHGARHRVSGDYTEAGSFLALAAATGGQVTVHGIQPEHFRMTRHVFNRLGIELTLAHDSISVAAEQSRRILPDKRGGIPVVDDGIWPQFPSDLMSVAIVLATQMSGTVLFFEKMYESRMYFVDRLVSMGANAVICDPHRAVVAGPARLQGIELSSPDIRAGMALLGAALCARGTSIIRGVSQIDRGYERIETKLQAIGADIQRYDE